MASTAARIGSTTGHPATNPTASRVPVMACPTRGCLGSTVLHRSMALNPTDEVGFAANAEDLAEDRVRAASDARAGRQARRAHLQARPPHARAAGVHARGAADSREGVGRGARAPRPTKLSLPPVRAYADLPRIRMTFVPHTGHFPCAAFRPFLRVTSSPSNS